MKTLGVLDLFSGIGGLSLGLEMTGRFKTLAFCELEPFKQKVLQKNFPGVPIFKDVRKINYEKLRSFGHVDVVCGGYPCQGESLAGKRAGSGDDRWLWPEMRNVIERVQPTWAIGENSDGHSSMGLDSVLSDLESLHYRVWASCIPACAVGAPHERKRVIWIATSIPYAESEWGEQRGGIELQTPSYPGWSVCDGKYQSEPPRVADGLPDRMDRNSALGDSLVPQVFYVLGQAIAAVHDRWEEIENDNRPATAP